MIPLIAVEGVTKRYGSQQVLHGVEFTVETGAAVAVIGKNGSGKSTLLAIMAAMLKPDSGHVLLDGSDLFSSAAQRRRIGYLPQGDSLFGELSVSDNLTFWASALGIPARAASHSPFIGLLGLESFLEKRVDRLSGGMRRRAAICACLLGDPAYILLDEPFAGLDLVYRTELTGFLRGLRGMGKTLVYTTHSPDELTALSDSTLLLDGGIVALYQDTSVLRHQSENIEDTLLSYLKGEEQ